MWVCVLGLWFRLRPAVPGWGVGVCVCLCVRSACTPRILAWVFGVGVCAWARVSAAPRHSWLGSWGVSVVVRPPPVPSHFWLGFVVCWLGVAWHLFPCGGSLLVVRPVRVCGTRWPLLLGGSPCALAVAGGKPLRPALWPRVGALSVLWSAFATPWCLSPPRGLVLLDLLGACAGHEEAGQEPSSLCLPLAAAEAGRHNGEQEPSGQGHGTHNTPSGHTGEQESSGQGHRTCNIRHRGCAPVNRSQVAKDTIHTANGACKPVNRI